MGEIVNRHLWPRSDYRKVCCWLKDVVHLAVAKWRPLIKHDVVGRVLRSGRHMMSASAATTKLENDAKPQIEKFDPWEQKFKSHLRPVKLDTAPAPEQTEA